MRTSTLFRVAASVLLAALVGSASIGCGESEDVGTVEGAAKGEKDTYDKTTIPLDELSGLAVRKQGRATDILAISDAVATIAIGRIASGEDIDRVDWQLRDVREALAAAGVNPPGKRGAPQWEAVAADGDGRILVLEENPGGLIVFNADATRVEYVIDFDVSQAAAGWVNEGDDDSAIDLVGSWGMMSDEDREALEEEGGKALKEQEARENSRGEGMVLLKSGHVLVAKEKDPAVLIEFAPPRSRPVGYQRLGATEGFAHPRGQVSDYKVPSSLYVPVRVQGIQVPADVEFGDISELAVGPRGGLYVVTEKDGSRLGRLADLDRAVARVTATWPLETATAAEGLTFLGTRPLIGLDVRLNNYGEPKNLWAVNGTLATLE
jgi:hypothetical protein